MVGVEIDVGVGYGEEMDDVDARSTAIPTLAALG